MRVQYFCRRGDFDWDAVLSLLGWIDAVEVVVCRGIENGLVVADAGRVRGEVVQEAVLLVVGQIDHLLSVTQQVDQLADWVGCFALRVGVKDLESRIACLARVV